MIVVLIDDVNTYQEVYLLINFSKILAMQQSDADLLRFSGKKRPAPASFSMK